MKSGVLWCTAAVLAVGCIEPPIAPEPEPTGVLLITTETLTYDPADPIVITVRNKSESLVRMNLCPWALDRWTGTVWEVATLPLVTCAVVAHGLLPHHSAQTTIQLAGDFADGSYRIRFEQLLDDQGVLLPMTERVTNVFRFE